jgi:DHA1 family tetracycline resistance protein-like MFS transporter
VGLQRHLGHVATGALVSLLAATTIIVQPWAGRRLDRGGLGPHSAMWALLGCATGLIVVVVVPGALGIALGAVTVGVGVAVATPLGFSALAESALPGRMGQTMGAGEVGRELGDAGGPLVVGAGAVLSLAAGFGALAAAIVLAAGASLWLDRAIERECIRSEVSDHAGPDGS